MDYKTIKKAVESKIYEYHYIVSLKRKNRSKLKEYYELPIRYRRAYPPPKLEKYIETINGINYEIL